MKWITWVTLGLAGVVVLLVTWMPGAVASPLAANYAVLMTDNAFQPQSITLQTGDTLVWTNNGVNVHTTTSSGIWDSSFVASGQTYSRTFNSPGTFPYSCTVHANLGMTGTITVQGTAITPTPTPVRNYLPYLPKDPTPTPTATPTATPTPVPGWTAQFYNNLDLSGSPAVTRVDSVIDFDWGDGSPATGVQADGFSVRWTRTLNLAGGDYNFFAYADDGVRLWVDGNQVIDEWHETSGQQYHSAVPLTAGNHTVRMEAYNSTGRAAARLSYIDSSVYPQPDQTQWGSWKGEYFDNPNLSGDPKVVRRDDMILFNWGDGSPDAAIPSDNFSVRWTGSIFLKGGDYNFFPRTDDGVRLYVDGQLVIDEWHDQGPTQYISSLPLSEGTHLIRMEYFDRVMAAEASLWWHNSSAYSEWLGEYFSNKNLSGSPTVVRADDAIDFDWSSGSPADGIPQEGFSVRWTGVFLFNSDDYAFSATVDDGVRLWIDGNQGLDEWRNQGQTTFVSVMPLSEGYHFVRMEYFQDIGGAIARLTWD